MAFGNPVVGGTTLIRQAIKSPNYVAGSAGWSINKDGSAEFNDLSARGDVTVGPSNGPQVVLETQVSPAAGIIAFPSNRAGEDSPARMSAVVGNQGAANEYIYLGIDGAAWASPAGDFISMAINSQNKDDSSTANANMVYNYEGGSSLTLFIVDPDGFFITDVDFQVRGNSPNRVIKGKQWTGANTNTNTSTATDTNVTNAALSNVTVKAGKAYRASFTLRISGDVTAASNLSRALFKIKDGTTQLGTHARQVMVMNTTTSDVSVVFEWSASADATIGTLNLTVQNMDASGTITANVNSASYRASVEEIGNASLSGF